MIKRKLDWIGLAIGGVEAVIGVLLLINAQMFNTAVIIIGGLSLCVLGIRSLVVYFRAKPKVAMVSNDFLEGACFIGAGVVCLFKTGEFAGDQVQTLVYGLFLLLAGIWMLQDLVNMLRLQLPRWEIAAVTSGLSLAAAVVIFINPFSDLQGLWIFVGISLLVVAAVGVGAALLGKPVVEKEPEKKPEPAPQKLPKPDPEERDKKKESASRKEKKVKEEKAPEEFINKR